MEEYKSHIKLLQDRIKSKHFDDLDFMSDEELKLTDAPPIISPRYLNIVELKRMYPEIEVYAQDRIQSERELLNKRHSDEKRELQLQLERGYNEMENEMEQVKPDIERIEQRDGVFNEVVSIRVNDIEMESEEEKSEPSDMIAEAETIKHKADAHDQWKETKRKANTKRANTNKMTEDVKGHIESILTDRFTYISSVSAFNNRAGDVRHLPFVPNDTIYWFTGGFSGDNPIFSPSTSKEFEKKSHSYLKRPSQQ